jgi:hypothetical protein
MRIPLPVLAASDAGSILGGERRCPHGYRTINEGDRTLMRRLVAALMTTIAIWLVASIVFAAVAHLDSASRLIYPLGALIVGPIPVMLLLLFFILRRALRSESPGAELTTAGPIEPEVVMAVADAFPHAEQAEAIAILATYGTGADEPERPRVRLAIVRLSEGDIERLRYFTDQAKQEYRDVLSWGVRSPTLDNP